MSIELPESYWNDVNRWSGELLTGVAPRRVSILVVSSEVQRRSWPAAAEGVTSRLERGTVRILGGLIGKRSFHSLSQLSPGPPGATGGDNAEYVIAFDPDKRVIERATSQLEFREPEQRQRTPGEVVGELFSLKDYIGGRNRLRSEMQDLGLAVPGPADYDLLHSELQRGVALLPPIQE
jgi:hypothetical protein